MRENAKEVEVVIVAELRGVWLLKELCFDVRST